MDDLLKILQEIKPGVDFSSEKELIKDRILDSFSIVRLVSELEDKFDVEITPIDIVPENFCSAEAIFALIQKLEDE